MLFSSHFYVSVGTINMLVEAVFVQSDTIFCSCLNRIKAMNLDLAKLRSFLFLVSLGYSEQYVSGIFSSSY
ncbi:hypothetical protein L6452_09340 [Arctium lappa]|uniref:Uncharacterized protein n=1 Tax=Arctium lappa TaxID=4217 RepID=A0ACB9DKL9_ARCLA|nr:hypothetical protein L6452_09340 [Arctium lappa]